MRAFSIRRRDVIAGAVTATVTLPVAAAYRRPFLAVAGDSLAVGLAGALLSINPDAPVVGYGVVSSGLRSKIPVDWQVRIREVVSTRPSMALVLIGMNDVVSSPGLDYLQTVIDFFKPLSEERVFFGIVSVPQTDDPAMNVRINTLNQIFAILAPTMKGHFVNVPPLSRDMRQRDGIHFTTAGYKELACRVLTGMLLL